MNSVHMNKRMQQRAIPPLITLWLEEFGEEHHDHKGATILYFSKRSRRRLEQAVGRRLVHKLEEFLGAYLVISTDGTGITAGKRYKRIWH